MGKKACAKAVPAKRAKVQRKAKAKPEVAPQKRLSFKQGVENTTPVEVADETSTPSGHEREERLVSRQQMSAFVSALHYKADPYKNKKLDGLAQAQQCLQTYNGLKDHEKQSFVAKYMRMGGIKNLDWIYKYQESSSSNQASSSGYVHGWMNMCFGLDQSSDMFFGKGFCQKYISHNGHSKLFMTCKHVGARSST